MTSCINLDLKFSVLKLRGWSCWEDVILLVVKSSQVLRLMIDTVLFYLLLYTWFIPSDTIKYVLWSDLIKTAKSHNFSVIKCSAIMRDEVLFVSIQLSVNVLHFFEVNVWQDCELVDSFFSELVYIISIFLLPAKWNTVKIEIFQQTLFLLALEDTLWSAHVILYFITLLKFSGYFRYHQI